MPSDLSQAVSGGALYYRALWHMLVKKGSYDELRSLCGAPRVPFWSKVESKQEMTEEEERRLFTAVWLHTIALSLDLWSVEHYRAPSLRHDLVDNFRNIAFPGTGIPMSWVCCCKAVAIVYFLLVHPLVIMVASMFIARSPAHGNGRSTLMIFRDELLAPRHWFALWRINSTLVAAHHTAHAGKPEVQDEYRYENKWDFLKLALEQEQAPASTAIKVTPIIANVKEMVCKHKNIEGGMGIHIFKNSAHGGDWILQERLYNCEELNELLPEGAPLSTFRVITMADPTAETFEERHVPMTFVWRAGRKGKATDHSSLLYSVDPKTLRVQQAKAFSNWYQVGRVGTSNMLSKQNLTVHPDTGRCLQGAELSCAKSAVDMCVEAHRRLMPNVPAIGWDVGVADGHGAVLLEANLSCNFFGGVYDKQAYLRIVDTYFANGCRPEPMHNDDSDSASTARMASASDGITDEAASVNSNGLRNRKTSNPSSPSDSPKTRSPDNSPVCN